MEIKTSYTLGIDLGRTIVHRVNGIQVLLPDADRVIRRLVLEKFDDKVHIISRVTPEQQKRAEAWLRSTQFLQSVGIATDHLHFCAERRGKAPICHRLGITHFIDDRPEVMCHMPFVPHRFLFQANQEDVEKWQAELSNIVQVESWLDIERHMFG